MHHGSVSPQIARGLLALRKRIDAARIPSSKLDETINVAVWNIREFGNPVHPRTPAALHYIAEILGQFDLVALVELRDNLSDLKCVLDYLGHSWDVVYSDWMGDAGGNRERTAFLYDRRAVCFNGLAAEIDAPRSKQATEYLATQSFWRAPYMCSFRAGNFDFIAIANHARWGESLKGRAAELKLLSDWIKLRFADRYVEDHDLVVMGDFNIPQIDDVFFKALTDCGLKIPQPLRRLTVGERFVGGSNLGKNKRYDQILHLPTTPDNVIASAGTLDFFVDDDHIRELFPDERLSRAKFTYQLSDHLPIWVQMKVDIDGFRLGQLIQNARKRRRVR
ncbi:MAG TPA: endonuclease/exonuclease/phosphatase family protein [Opitutus sp.]|nr:endonuclease/exonuclease/phosphatase family protein [Opitutus sp.]